MDTNISVNILYVDGMSCVSCERKIENALKKIKGIVSVNAKFSNSSAKVEYDKNKVKLGAIISTIESCGYSVIEICRQSDNFIKKNKTLNKNNKFKFNNEGKLSEINQMIGIGFIIFALFLIINNTIGFNFIPNIDKSVSYSALFVIGILTSLHCAAMCGGINLSVCSSYKFDPKDRTSKFKPSLLYNLGRVISYTVIGGIVGLLGSVVSFSNSTKSMLIIFSGVFMIIMGLNMINIFPWLRKLNPRMPKIFSIKITESKKNKSPFFVGLLNSLIPCGPLQAMQLYALGTGSFLTGALSMFLFSIGTVPLMFGLGAVSSLLSSRYTKKMLKASALLVMMLGVIMINRGFRLSGISIFAANSSASIYTEKTNTSSSLDSNNSVSESGSESNSGSNSNIAKVNGNIQTVTAKLGSGSYPYIVVQKGIPVKFTLKADNSSISGCNQTVVIPDFNVQKTLIPGNNVIEFTPTKTGNILYTCWMGMIAGNIKVVDKIDNSTKAPAKTNTQIPYQQNTGGMSCCSGGNAVE